MTDKMSEYNENTDWGSDYAFQIELLQSKNPFKENKTPKKPNWFSSDFLLIYADLSGIDISSADIGQVHTKRMNEYFLQLIIMNDD